MKFTDYIFAKKSKATKAEMHMLWASTSISRKEFFIFYKNIEKLELDTFVRGRGDKKTQKIDGLVFEFGVDENTLDTYVKVENKTGEVFIIKHPKYRTSKSVELKFLVK